MPENKLKITVVYDNRTLDPVLKPDWGFAAVVDIPGTRLLFDTGADGQILLANMENIGIAPATINAIVISHNHWDHTGGLVNVLHLSPVNCFVPASAATEFGAIITTTAGKIVPVKRRQEILPRVWSTGELGATIPEQSLLINTGSGLVLITGCAHPGIVNIIQRIKQDFGQAPYFVLGGFHLEGLNPQEVQSLIRAMKDLGVKRIGPCHCTGEKVVEQFRQNWQNGFVKIGCGWALEKWE